MVDRKKILLLTNFACDDLCGGAAIIRHWASRLSMIDIEWVCLGRSTGYVPVQGRHITTQFHWPPARGNVRLHLGSFWAWYRRVIWSNSMARRLRQMLDHNHFDVVWIVFDFGLAPVLWRLLPALRKRRLHISLHDDPVPTGQREGCSKAFLREVADLQRELPQLDLTVDSVSEELLVDVLPDARRTAIVTLPAIASYTASEFRAPAATGPLKIGFSGNFHGQAEFSAFVAGLERWSVRSQRNWEMVAYGGSNLGELSPKISAFGPTPPQGVRVGLTQCDVLFLPSPLDRPEMRTNMPTKLVTYLEAGRLIFTFAPAGSATERVVKTHKLGPVVTKSETVAIDRALDQLTNWDIASAATGWQTLLVSRFNEARMERELRALLGI